MNLFNMESVKGKQYYCHLGNFSGPGMRSSQWGIIFVKEPIITGFMVNC